MGINSKYGVSAPAQAGTVRWKGYDFYTAQGLSITEGSGEQTLISVNYPVSTPGSYFLIKVMIFGNSTGAYTSPNLSFRITVGGTEIATDNLSAPSIDTETWMRGFSEWAFSTTDPVEVLWTFTSGTPGATMDCNRITLLIEEVTS